MPNINKITIKCIFLFLIVLSFPLLAVGCVKQKDSEPISVKDFFCEYEFVIPFQHEKFVFGSEKHIFLSYHYHNKKVL
ncbi:MAG: hypothetical protein FWF56_05080 [Firmicutes bacterium]|nr:hypothetical protein [Bacillota bacterium]